MKNTDIGQRIKKLRLKMGYSQPRFAELFDPPISKAAVSRWESGNRVPEPDKLKQIADITNSSVDYLLHGNVKNRISTLINEKKVTIQQLSQATHIDKDVIESYINGSEEPLLEDWIALASYFDVSVSYLKGETWDRKGILLSTKYTFENYAKLQNLVYEDVKNLSSKEKSEITETFFQFTLLTSTLTSYIGRDDSTKKEIKISREALNNLNTIIKSWLVVSASEKSKRTKENAMIDINKLTNDYLNHLGKCLQQYKI